MVKFSSLSNLLRNGLPVLGLLCPTGLLAGCGTDGGRAFSGYSEYVIAPADGADEADVKWADYLKRHWQKRALDKDCVMKGQAQDESQLQVLVDVDPAMKETFSFERNDRGVRLKARNAEAMTWLQYQFMAAAGAEDARFSVDDLPPALLSCRRDTSGTFAFEYRGIYSPSNTDADQMSIMGTNNVNFDWGLWGHNMRKIFVDGIPQEAKALVDGRRSENQFCFSSQTTYRAYENYVIDQYGPGKPGETVRFAVMPNDNAEVCLCDACRAAGNTPRSATPAVTQLVERLARRFPRHVFFTSAYATTTTPPSHALPSNVGVLVSVLSLPLKAGVEKTGQGSAAFESAVEAWKKVTTRIYVWDYMRNFDDYFTPYPCLRLLRERLQYYQKMGVRGLFFNGSGYDYAGFDDLQTVALSQLMVAPKADLDQIVRKFLHKRYPVTADILADFYLKAEDAASKSGLQPYAGIADAARGYLDQTAFETFWHRLDRASKKAGGEERKRLNRLLTALNLTRLELMRLQASKPEAGEVEACLELLSECPNVESMKHYREAHGEISQYLAQWQQSFPWIPANGNHLKGQTIKSLTSTDEGYENLQTLTDGKRGFTTDYHMQWVINSGKAWRLLVPAVSSATRPYELSLSFLHAPWWHIYAPAEVEARQDGKVLCRVSVAAAENGRAVAVLTMPEADGTRPVEITIHRAAQSGRVTVACDEIMEGRMP